MLILKVTIDGEGSVNRTLNKVILFREEINLGRAHKPSALYLIFLFTVLILDDNLPGQHILMAIWLFSFYDFKGHFIDALKLILHFNELVFLHEANKAFVLDFLPKQVKLISSELIDVVFNFINVPIDLAGRLVLRRPQVSVVFNIFIINFGDECFVTLVFAGQTLLSLVSYVAAHIARVQIVST